MIGKVHAEKVILNMEGMRQESTIYVLTNCFLSTWLPRNTDSVNDMLAVIVLFVLQLSPNFLCSLCYV